MPKSNREVTVFIASPGDLAPERQVFKATIDELNEGFGDGLGVQFRAVGWEDVLATTGRRAQGVINQDVDACDVFVLALHRRWGQSAPDSPASSYTEEEYTRALERRRKTGKPEILIFFKNVDSASLADPGPELQKVIAFKKQLEAQRDTLYRTFNSEGDFAREIDLHLRALARNDAARPAALTTIHMDPATLGQIPRADNSLVQAQLAEMALARSAMEAASAGRLQDAELLFAKAVEGTTDLHILEAAADFYRQTGQVESATRLVARHAAIAQDRMVAARHVLAMIPPGLMEDMNRQVLDQMLATYPEELADEVRSINDEVYGGGKLQAQLVEIYAQHFSTAELLLMGHMMGTAEGQSLQRKLPEAMREAMEIGGREFVRVAMERERRREANTIDGVAEHARLSGGQDT